jgi:protein-S-isoprenylcysteine O-methyltransferase Ste14
VSVWRHVRASVLLPGSMTIVVPTAILLAVEGPNAGWGLHGALVALPALAGAALLFGGIWMWAWTVRLFARIGEGTLAPWDPTRRLVVDGPYRYVRNPMIAAVLAILLGEALLLGSPALLAWCAAFFSVNSVYFLLTEEPGLERRFGEEYRAYKAAVPRWVPRGRPWSPSGGTAAVDAPPHGAALREYRRR